VIAALIPVGLVVAAIATMVVIKAAGNSNPPASASSHLSTTGSGGSPAPTNAGTTALSPQVVAALSVPAATLDSVGSPSGDVLPTKVGSGAVLKGADGKPLITYIGAEYCPFCAAERWAVAVALSRFGTFENLQGTHSSDSDEFPDTQTLSFYGSSYSSPYIDFQPVEEATNQPAGDGYQSLQTPTAAENALVAKYDPQGSIPFLDIANRYVITGSSYSPQVLQGLSRSQIAADLSNPDSAVAQAIDGTANDITAAIAAVTGNQPSSVGSSATIAAIEQKLGA
jgi:thiol-disulfide isomerase/thioredoxin